MIIVREANFQTAGPKGDTSFAVSTFRAAPSALN